MQDRRAPRYYDPRRIQDILTAAAAEARRLGLSIGTRIAGGSVGQQLIAGYTAAVLRFGLEPVGGGRVAHHATSSMGRYVSELRHPGIVTPLAVRVLRGTGQLPPISEVRLGVVAAERVSGRTIRCMPDNDFWRSLPDVESSEDGIRFAVALIAFGVFSDGTLVPLGSTLVCEPSIPQACELAYDEIAAQIATSGVRAPVYVDSLDWPESDRMLRAPGSPLASDIYPGDDDRFTDAFAEHQLAAGALVVDDEQLAKADGWTELPAPAGHPGPDVPTDDPTTASTIEVLVGGAGGNVAIKIDEHFGRPRYVRTSLSIDDPEALVEVARANLGSIGVQEETDSMLAEIAQRGTLELGVTSRTTLRNRVDAGLLELVCFEAYDNGLGIHVGPEAT